MPKAELKNVYFDLPFILWLRDSMGDPALREWAAAWAAGERENLPFSPYAPALTTGNQFVLGGPLPVYVPPAELADHYLIDLPGNGVECGLRFLRRANNQSRQGFHLMGAVPGDRVGRISFSSVKAMFDLEQFDEVHHADAAHFVELAVDAVNHFIAHYRVIADRPWVNAVTPQMLGDFQFETVYDDNTRDSYTYGASNGPLEGFGGAIAQESDQALRVAVGAQAPPPIHATLDANIRNNLDLRDWRMAAIEAAVLFEAWLVSAVKARLAVNGLQAADIDARFSRPNGVPHSVTHIAKTLVHEACQLDFQTTVEYADWATHARDVRNELVHGLRIDVTRNEAIRAYQSARAAMALIQGSL